MKEWLSTNPVDGDDMLRHDKWLCMMWPRLTLLRELLSERGSIWITLDDNEIQRARMVCDEIFGDEAFVNCFIWRKVDSPNDNKVAITPDHDYVLCYAKDKAQIRFSPMLAPGILDAYSNKTEDGRLYRDRLLKKNGKNSLRKDRPTMYFKIDGPDDKPVYPIHDNGEEACWAAGEKAVDAHRATGTLIWKRRTRGGAAVWEPYTREFAPDVPTRPYPTIWADVPTMRQAKAMLSNMFNSADVFDTPKPVELIERILDLANRPDALILDSFAGSGTTAHAVLKANAKDGGTRRFILIEGEDYADRLTAERVRRAIAGYAWSGTQRETLLEEKITLTQFKKAEQWLARIDAIKRAEGLADEGDAGGDLVEQATAAGARPPRFDKVEARIDDGVLRVEGVRRVSQRAPGLGGSFTYCTLGEAVELDKLLSGAHLPAFDALGAWLFYTATGGSLGPAPKDAPPHYLGEAADRHVWLIYRPDLAWLKSPDAALTLSRAEAMQAWGNEHARERNQSPKGHLVFAPAKYLSHAQLKAHGLDHAALPFALYRES
jgi:adenine-specific DNA-methyltransferase